MRDLFTTIDRLTAIQDRNRELVKRTASALAKAHEAMRIAQSFPTVGSPEANKLAGLIREVEALEAEIAQ